MDINCEKQWLLQSTVLRVVPTQTFHRKKFTAILVVTVISMLSLYISNPSIFESLALDEGFPYFKPPASRIPEDVCNFPSVDVFDPEIMMFYKHHPACNGKLENVTVLIQGKLMTTRPEEHECWGRCHTFKSGNETFKGEWYHTNQSFSFPCDIVEARCSPKSKDISSANYFFMHTQVVEVSTKEQTNAIEGKQYDVYFIVVDSQSHTQMYRNLNKTNEFLLSEMKAVNFPYMNRIGDSSANNGFAWFYGKMTERVDRSSFNMTSLEPEPEWKDYCKRKLDNETMIIHEFGDYGYMTNHVADWWRTVDYACVGTGDQLADHTYTPYAMYYEFNRQMINSMKDQCIHRHQHALEYLGQFVESYKDKPKMAFVWLSHVGHNTERGSMDADQHFLELFNKHKETFDNSFIFLAGDHGLRFTQAIKTKVGALDVNNPALVMTVPKEMRSNSELMATLRKNAEELQTHYDTRATLLDILKFQPAVNYDDRSVKSITGELGNSFLREQPKPRTCRTLPIPPTYCICENAVNEDILKTNPEDAKLIGIETIDRINLRLSNNTAVRHCRQWVFKETRKLVVFSKSPSLQFEGLFAVTNDRNLQGEFKIILGGRNETALDIISLTRIDSYKHAGDCVKRSLQPICDCY